MSKAIIKLNCQRLTVSNVAAVLRLIEQGEEALAAGKSAGDIKLAR